MYAGSFRVPLFTIPKPAVSHLYLIRNSACVRSQGGYDYNMANEAKGHRRSMNALRHPACKGWYTDAVKAPSAVA